VTKLIPVYHAADLQSAYASTSSNILEELHSCLRNGAGVFIVKGLYEDMRLLDRCDRAFQSIIERERREKGFDSKGDHFAPAGQNDRVWNSFQKLAMESSEDFVEYYANPVL
jgi:ectoine hydroxylase-related dioxygenase (phytanoyl-CoA dioxygenase family)